MPQRKAYVTDLRKNHTRRMQNLDIKTELKKTIKSFLSSVESKDKKEATTRLGLVNKKLDKASKRNIIAKNTVARRKSKFSKLLNTI